MSVTTEDLEAFGDVRHFVTGDRGVSEWLFTGNGCDLFTFRDGKIVRKDSCFKNRLA